ncbi:hypothetical protein [Nocardioides marmorisolisilvae]|uniref:hypothetical protein n=1 Tax=Nocardioides marmorisolisilvae TaxID=1542737 RepID=UPI0011CDCA35|nr:hypothetical protein [Nocardioides marmorisolisilvae]
MKLANVPKFTGILFLSLVSAVLVGVVSPPAGAEATRSRSLPSPTYAQATKDPDWIETPSGLVNKSCVHRVPPGATVAADGSIIDGDVVTRVKRCPYAGPVRPANSPKSARPDARTPSTGGWWIDSWWHHSWLSGISANWSVPSAPTDRVDQTLFFFPSLETETAKSIVQPVLQWGASAAGGGQYWSIGSWYVTGNSSYYSTLSRAYSGDSLTGKVALGTCASDGGNCEGYIHLWDNTRGYGTSLDVSTPAAWTNAQSGVMENYGVSSCTMLPASGWIQFSSVVVTNGAYQQVDPSFYLDRASGSCNSRGSLTQTTMNIAWN